MSSPCTCFTSVYVQNLSVAYAFVVVWRLVYISYRPSLTSYGVSYLLIFLYGLLPLWGSALFDCELFFLQPTLLLLSVVLHFLMHYFAIPAMMLFDPSLLGLFESAAYSSLDDSIWSLGLLLHAYGLLCPIYFFLGVLGPFTFLRHPLPFLILQTHGLLLTPLSFPGSITLSFILGAHKLAINPLLSLFALLRAYCDPFLLYYITYCPWVCYFSLFGLL